MAITQNTFTTANSTTTEFDFTFPYLEQNDVKVRVDGTDTTAFTFVNATRIKLNTAPASGKKVIVYRNTDNDIKKASFYPGSAIKAEDLNSNADQLLYAVQEIDNNALSNLGEGELKQSDVGIASDFGVKFEGATTDGNFTTLKAKAQTTNRIIRLPDAAGTLVVSALDDNTIQTANIANDAIDSTKLADNAVNSEHYTDGSIDHVHLAGDAVDGDNIADNSINSEHYVDGSIDLAHMSANSIDSDQYVDGSIDTAHIADLNVTTAKIASDAVTGAKIADDAVGAEHIERLDNHLLFADNMYAKFGASDDFVIGHSSGDNFSYIQENHPSGGLRIKAEHLLLEDTAGDNYMYCIHDGAVKLYYDSAEKLATTSTGVSIAGDSSIGGNLDLAAGLLFGPENHYFYRDNANRVVLRVGDTSGSHTYGSFANRSGVFAVGSASGDVIIEVGNESTPDQAIKCRNNNAVELYYDNSKKFETFSNGVITHGSEIRFQNPGGTVALEVGNGATGDNYAFIDFIGDATYSDYGARFLRSPGANGATSIMHRGTGAAGFSSLEGSYWSFSTSSDYRLKENVVSITDGITKLKTLKPYRFNYKHTPDKVVDGFFAHEASTVVPHAVTGTKDEVMLENGPLPGDLKKGDPVYQSIDYSKLTPLLTAALQEAIARIEVLETEVATLKG